MLRTFALAFRFNTLQMLFGLLFLLFGVTGALTVMPEDPASAFAAPDYKTIFTIFAVIGFVLIVLAVRSASKFRSQIVANALG